jgi:predicted hydrocarbon binding protein
MTLNEAQAGFLRDSDGVLRESMASARVMIMSCSAYRSMCDALFDQFQSGAGVILYRMGEGYAQKLVGAIPKLGMSTEEAIKAFQHLAYLAGWGKLKLRIVNQTSGECLVERSAFVLHRQDLKDNTCFFFAGVLAATSTTLFGKPCTAREVKCASSGAPLCKFLIYEDEKKTANR